MEGTNERHNGSLSLRETRKESLNKSERKHELLSNYDVLHEESTARYVYLHEKRRRAMRVVLNPGLTSAIHNGVHDLLQLMLTNRTS